MKKIFTFLSVAAVALSMSAETVILSNAGKVKQNVLSGTELGANVPEGFSLQCMNEAKNLESGKNFTIDGEVYTTIKLSNGAQNQLTLPEGYVATKLTLYSTINKTEPTGRVCYWKEVAGTQYTEDDNEGIIDSYLDYNNPNVQSFDIPNLNVVTFANTGEQPFIVLEVTYEEAGSAVLPTFPDSFEVDTNLNDITIWQGSIEDIAESGVELDETALEIASWGYPETAIVLSGITDMKQFELSFDLPAGWLGVAPVKINTQGGYYNLNTRANDFDPAPLDEFLSNYEYMMGLFDTKTVEPGNPLTIPVTSEAQYYLGFLYLHDDGTLSGDPEFAGDFVDAANSVLIVVDVTDGVEVVEPTFPERLEFTMNGEKELEGVEVTWGVDEYDGAPVINVEGTSSADTITFTFTTPEGWSGFLIQSDGEVSNIENTATRAASDWSPASRFEDYFDAGNSVTFETGEENDALIILVWGDKAYNTWIGLNFNVEKKTADNPVFPETFDVTLSNNEGVEVEQYIEQEVYTISVTGKSSEKELTLTLAVPEGWDGFLSMSQSSEVEPLSTRAEEPEWLPIEEALYFGGSESNSMTFPVDGESYFGQFMLVKDGMADIANQINVEFCVEYDAPTGVNGVNAAEKAAYYDLQGNKISTPKAGMFVKVVDGKATKVVVK